MAINPNGPLYMGSNAESANPSVVRIGQALPVRDPRIGRPGAHLIGDEDRAKEQALAGERPNAARLIIARLNPNNSMIQFGTNKTEEMEKEDFFNKQAVENMDKITRTAEQRGVDPERIQKHRETIRRALTGESPTLRAGVAQELGYDATVEQEHGVAIPLTPKASQVQSIMRKNAAGGYWQDVRQGK